MGCPYLCIMCGRGCTLERGNPGVSLPLHNVWGRMYAGGGKSRGVPKFHGCQTSFPIIQQPASHNLLFGVSSIVPVFFWCATE